MFLVDAFHGNEAMADSVNHLLVVGFYLINVGLHHAGDEVRRQAARRAGAVEFLSTKIGLVLLILGAMHFFNLAVFSAMRRRGIDGHPTAPVQVNRIGN